MERIICCNTDPQYDDYSELYYIDPEDYYNTIPGSSDIEITISKKDILLMANRYYVVFLANLRSNIQSLCYNIAHLSEESEQQGYDGNKLYYESIKLYEEIKQEYNFSKDNILVWENLSHNFEYYFNKATESNLISVDDFEDRLLFIKKIDILKEKFYERSKQP